MTFDEVCGKIYAREMKKEMEYEIANADHNNISAFHSCRDRAEAFSFPARKCVMNFSSLCFVLSRLTKETSDEKIKVLEKEKESTLLLMVEYPEDIAAAEQGIYVDGWWIN